MTEVTHAITIKDLRKSFGKLNVLNGINLEVERGTILAVLGPNGAGKTTTVRILSTLLTADSGVATVEGFDVSEQADDVRGVIGLTGQYAAVDEFLTAKENLRMMGRLYHLSKDDSVRRADELLEQFKLVDAADRVVKTFSGGMKRRLDLAASLIAIPPVLYLDEPTTGLDPRSRLAMWDVIKKLAEEGSTILLTTQYMEEADQLADRIVVIDGGKIIADGTPDELKQKIGSERVEFTFESDTDFAKASKVIDGEALQTDKTRKSISLANDGGARNLRVLLEKLEQNNVDVGSLSLHKPTLDDVFLQLTGRATTTEDEPDEEQSKQKKGKK
jgi:ABC-2 type transport system ATP-binding protein